MRLLLQMKAVNNQQTSESHAKLKKKIIEVAQNQLVDLTKSVNLKAKNNCYVVK